ncbi:hypothetical protein ABAC460_08845 [Asticcacaulis sp. AC460]|uniref:hypothetical protein n=1 Tax=Asticcacaulis sp. AC460 TaxID=1282360 RepID=UPI0003C3B229|nr:hypothetical protein [Asticcacaulis sp. AC460]ESQ90585.1 hypothetical protein ABAC460_08845 [Asticcacaulis sp. AC460]
MSIKNFPGKLKAMAEKLGFGDSDIEIYLRQLAQDAGIEYRVVAHWVEKEDLGLRGDTATKFYAYFLDKLGRKFDGYLTRCSLEQFRDALDLPGQAKGCNVESFVGIYQVIRPHCARNGRYVLEAMEIARDGAGFKTYFYSYRQPERRFMYEGAGLGSIRYYFSMMSRQHEEAAGFSSFRCVSFYVSETEFNLSLSGVMLRGTSGNAMQKSVAGIPFIAIKLSSARSLREVDPVRLENSSKKADVLNRLQRDGHLLLGSIERAWNEDLTAYCEKLFQYPALKAAFETRHSQIIFTVPQNDLRDIDELSEEQWCTLSAGLNPPPTSH